MKENESATKAEVLLERLAAANTKAILAGHEIMERGVGGKPYIVKVSQFRGALAAGGVSFPDNPVEFAAWAKPIADKVLPRYQRILRK